MSVYCNDCKHQYEKGHGYKCRAVYEFVDNPLRKEKKHKACWDANKDNACSSFAASGFVDKLWRFATFDLF